MEPTPPYDAPVTPARSPATPARPGLRVQNLLLGLGTGLVAVAAVVFTAVTWDRLDAAVQAAVLLGCTGLTALLCGAAARHRMPATAEALGLVTVLLALVDAQAVRVGGLPAVDGAGYWAVALAGVAGLAWALALATGINGTRLVAVVVGQLPVVVLVLGADVGLGAAGSILLAQVLVVIELADRARGSRADARALAVTVAALTWVSVIGATLVQLGFDDGRAEPAVVLAAAAVAPALVAWRRRWDGAIRVLGLLAASVLGIAALATALDGLVAGEWLPVAFGAGTVLLVAIGLRAPARWGRIPAGVAAGGGLLALTPLVAAVAAAVDAAGRVTGSAWDLAPGDRASTFVSDPNLVAGAGPLAALLLVAVALAAATWPLAGRRGLVVGAAASCATAVVIAPLLLPLDLAGTTLVVGAGAVLAAAVAVLVPRRDAEGGARPWPDGVDLATVVRWVAATASVGLGALAVAWSSATIELSVVGTGTVTLLAALLAVAGRRHDDGAMALPAAVVACIAGSVAVGLFVRASGGTPADGMVATGIAALAAGLAVGLLVDPAGRADRVLDRHLVAAVEGSGWAVHGALLWTAASGAADLSVVAALLATGTVAAGLHAIRPNRRSLASAAAIEGLLFVWLQLGSAGVATAEAYTLPLAAVLLAAGLLAHHRAVAAGQPAPPSWVTLGPALVVGLAPTVVLAFGDPGLVRPLGGLVAGALVLALGAVSGRRAPVDVGATTVVLLGLLQLVPVVGQLPNWAIIGATGAFLLALGATFEQRRRDLHVTRVRYAALR